MKRQMISIEAIKLDPSNSRKHKSADVEATADSLLAFGQQTPIVITKDKMVVKGNGTTMAARLLIARQAEASKLEVPRPEDHQLLAQDWSRLWYVETALDGPELKAYSIADNKTGMLAPFDLANVGEAMRGFRDIGRLRDFSIGWSEREVGQFMGVVPKDDPGDKLDRVEELDAKWGVRPGDLFAIRGRLGEHRLLCGDCTQADNLVRLMAGKSADLLLTDPPYNVDYAGHVGSERAGIDNDDHGEDFGAWLHSALTAAAMSLGKGRSWYVFYANSESFHVFSALKNAAMEVRQCLIWKKNSMVMGRQDYHWQHEPAVYGWTSTWHDDPIDASRVSLELAASVGKFVVRGPHPDGYTEAFVPVAYGWKVGGSHRWFSDRKQTTVLEFDRPSRSEDHPTMKPVPLIAYLMRNSSRMGEVVLDIFLGSGTTMYAAEQTQRLCYGTELSPKFCAVILERMQSAGCQIKRVDS